jgi:cell division protein FtsB
MKKTIFLMVVAILMVSGFAFAEERLDETLINNHSITVTIVTVDENGKYISDRVITIKRNNLDTETENMIKVLEQKMLA